MFNSLLATVKRSRANGFQVSACEQDVAAAVVGCKICVSASSGGGAVSTDAQ